MRMTLMLAVLATAVSTGANASKSTFHSSGTITVTSAGGTLTCDAQQTGTTPPLRIKTSTHSGAPGCSDLISSGLPWTYHSTGLTTGYFNSVTLTSPLIGQCGPKRVLVIRSGNTITYADTLIKHHGQSACVVSGSSTGTTP